MASKSAGMFIAANRAAVTTAETRKHTRLTPAGLCHQSTLRTSSIAEPASTAAAVPPPKTDEPMSMRLPMITGYKYLCTRQQLYENVHSKVCYLGCSLTAMDVSTTQQGPPVLTSLKREDALSGAGVTGPIGVMWALEIFVVVLLVVKVVQWLSSYFAYRKCFNNCLGEKDFSWIFGSLHKFPGPTEEGLAYFRQKTIEFPKYYCLWTSPLLPLLFLHHPDSVKIILRSSEPKPRKVLGVSSIYEIGAPWLGEGLLISNGAKWHRNRHLLTPAFHVSVLRPYVNVINKTGDVLMNKIACRAEAGESMELFSHVSVCSLDILLQCAFSFESNCQQTGGASHPFIKAVSELEELWIDRALKPYLFNDLVYSLSPQSRRFSKQCRFVHDFAKNIIDQRRQTVDQQHLRPTSRFTDLLDVMLMATAEDGTGMTDEEIRNEVDTFLFAGHDTTTSAICWTLYSLACEPDHQLRVQEELDSLLDSRDNKGLGWSDLSKLDYLTACIKEGLRLHSPVPTVQRITTQEVTIEGQTFPAGTPVAISLYGLHHNPDVWPDSLSFRPDRFLGEEKVKRDPFAFLPFSAGARNCIGQHFAMQELQILVGKILYLFDLSVDTSVPVEKEIGVTMRAKNGINLFFKKRPGKH